VSGADHTYLPIWRLPHARRRRERSDGLAVDVGLCVGWLVCFAPDGVLNADELLGVRLALAADEDLARTIVVTTQPRLLTRPADLRSSHDNSLARAG
jgi:hypothetical protein